MYVCMHVYVVHMYVCIWLHIPVYLSIHPSISVFIYLFFFTRFKEVIVSHDFYLSICLSFLLLSFFLSHIFFSSVKFICLYAHTCVIYPHQIISVSLSILFLTNKPLDYILIPGAYLIWCYSDKMIFQHPNTTSELQIHL